MTSWNGLNKKVSYFAFLNEDNDLGVVRKIHGTVSDLSLSVPGLDADVKIYELNLSGVISFIIDFLRERSDLIFVRCSNSFSLILFLLFIFQRMIGAKIVIDVPTPRKAVIKEILKVERGSYLVRFLRCSAMILFHNFQCWSANGILANGYDHWFFTVGSKHKTIQFNNGIYLQDIPVKTPADCNEKSFKTCVASGNLKDWHGFDRLIRALEIYNQRNSQAKLKLLIVGDGPSRNILEKLVEELGLQDYVDFAGQQKGDKYFQCLLEADIACSSLGIHRIGLEQIATLKQREYTAVGLPIVYATEDSDFFGCAFTFKASSDEDLASVVSALESALSSSIPPQVIRKYAEDNLSYFRKLEPLLLRLGLL